MARKWILVATVSALGAAVALNLSVSCGDGGSTSTDVGAEDGTDDDADGRTEPNWTDGVTADFVINTMRIGRIDDGEGFDLDGIDTGPSDYLPEDGPGGVDNQLGALIEELVRAGLDFDADADIARGIADGSLLILLRHLDVDSWTSDPGLIRLLGYAGKDPDDDPLNNLTRSGEILVDDRSLEPGHLDDLMASLIQFDNGVLENTTAADSVWQEGDFEAGPSLFRVDIPVQEATLTLAINGTRVVWDLETAPEGDPPVNGSIINGLLGGYVFVSDAARALQEIDLAGAGIDVATIRTILGPQADIDVKPEGFEDFPCTVETVVEDCAPAQTCEPDPDRGGAEYCYESRDNPDAISLGIVFTGVSCVITDIWHEPPPADADADADVVEDVADDMVDDVPETSDDVVDDASDAGTD